MSLRATSAACVLTVAAFAVVEATGDSSLVGRLAPEIQTTDWIHGDGRTTLADFRGDVVLLEFWATHCCVSRGETRHLVKLAEDLGKKGLEVIALSSGDDRRSITRFLSYVDPSPNYHIAVGCAGGYAMTRLPCAVLVGPDGTVLLDGTGGHSFTDKDVEAALKGARAATAEELEARAAKRLAFAETFVKDRLFARAEYELLQTVKLGAGTPSAKKAQERLKTFEAPEIAAEIDAQKEVAKIAGLNATFEHADDKIKSSDLEALVKRLLKKADEIGIRAPRAAKLARDWTDVLEEPWKDK